MKNDASHLEMLKDFQAESKNLIQEMLGILEDCEQSFSQVKRLEIYGQTVDRIMGAAKSLGVEIKSTEHFVNRIGDMAALCKAVGYKASQIRNNEPFYTICVSLLLDATEMLGEMNNALFDLGHPPLRDLLSKTFLDRLKWVSSQFGAEYRASVDLHKGKAHKMNQEEIDVLLSKLGLD